MKCPDPTELTKAQKDAVKQLKLAFAAAKKARIYFYQNLDNVFALNGNVVECVFTYEDSHRADCSLSEFSTPVKICDRLLNSFADDDHFVLFKEAAKRQEGHQTWLRDSNVKSAVKVKGGEISDLEDDE